MSMLSSFAVSHTFVPAGSFVIIFPVLPSSLSRADLFSRFSFEKKLALPSTIRYYNSLVLHRSYRILCALSCSSRSLFSPLIYLSLPFLNA